MDKSENVTDEIPVNTGCYYVKAFGDDAKDGRSEHTAFKTLAVAVNAAKKNGSKVITVIGVLNEESESTADTSLPCDPDVESIFYIEDSGTEEITITGINGAELRGSFNKSDKKKSDKDTKRVIRITGMSCIRFENIIISRGKVSGYNSMHQVAMDLINSMPCYPPHGHGGGMYISKGAVVTLGAGAIVSNNEAYLEGCGGGISVIGAALILSGGEVCHNEAGENGGGIYVAGSSFSVENGRIQNDPHYYDTRSENMAVISGILKAADGIIAKNTAGNEGGGIFIEKGTLEMTGSEIRENHAFSGAGICIRHEGKFNMSGGAIMDNHTIKKTFYTPGIHRGKGCGGGIFVQYSSFEMSNGIVKKNTALNGGGICINSKSTFRLIKGEVQGNKADEYGGGLWIYEDSVFTQEGGFIHDTGSGSPSANRAGKSGHAVYRHTW
jgi:hypothetical protein